MNEKRPGDAGASWFFSVWVSPIAVSRDIRTGEKQFPLAVSLDGGISDQLVIREADGSRQRWIGWRHLRLGLIVLLRSVAGPAVRSR